jgi:hypothetical protein
VAWSSFGRRGARNPEQTRTHGIMSRFRASDAVVVQDTHIRREAVVAIVEYQLRNVAIPIKNGRIQISLVFTY